MLNCTMDYQTRVLNEDPPGPSSFELYPGYQQFHPNVHSFRDESPARSESPSNLSSSNSEGIFFTLANHNRV